MTALLRRRAAVTLLAVALTALLTAWLTACTSAGSAPKTEARTRAAQVDLCTKIDQKVVEAALHGKLTGCSQAAAGDGYAATFSGRARRARAERAATVVVAYAQRYDPADRTDRWNVMGRATGTAVPMIGVGDNAVFDPSPAKGRPHLVTVAKDLIVTVEVRINGAAVPQGKLPEHVMDIGRGAVAALG